VRLHGRPEQRGTDLSLGRAHDRIVAAEVGRTASSSWKRAAPGRPDCARKRNVVGANPDPRDRRPSDERRSGSSNTRRPFTGRHAAVISAARSQGPPLHRSGGPPHRGSEEGRRSAVTGASEGERSVDSTGRQRPRRTTEPRHPKRVGRRENAPRIRVSPQGSSSGRRTKRGCPSSMCRWQKLVARISGR